MHEPYLWAIGLKYSLIDGSIFHFKLTLGPLQLKRLVVIYGMCRSVQILIYMFKNISSETHFLQGKPLIDQLLVSFYATSCLYNRLCLVLCKQFEETACGKTDCSK